MRIDREAFLQIARPALERATAQELADQILSRWSSQEICPLLYDRHLDVRKITCAVLSMVGDEGSVACLVEALSESDAQMQHLAEHALWSVWSRLGTDQACYLMHQGVQLLEKDHPCEGLMMLRQAIAEDPTFAEPHHQCGMACAMMEDWHTAIAHYQQAVELMPVHFAAYAGCGHAYLEVGQSGAALKAYRKSLKIHPGQEDIARAVREFKQVS